LLASLKNEAELAFILAHELAHLHLDHHESLADTSLSPSRRRTLELDADSRAVALVAAAGYDPRAAIGALHRTDLKGSTHRPEDGHAQTPLSHPLLHERFETALRLISNSGWQPPGTVNRRDFTLIRNYVAQNLRVQGPQAERSQAGSMGVRGY
jgi:predicted Zn-dependent protease